MDESFQRGSIVMDTRNVDSKVSSINLDNASQFLVEQLNELELNMASAYKKKKADDLFLLGCQYKFQLKETINKLQSISRYCITQLAIENINASKDENNIPVDYRCYINLFLNMIDMIQREIMASGLPLAPIRMERWIYILKSAHEQHDYFTAGIILFALCSESIIKSRLESNLSPTAKAIFKYYEKIYSKSHLIHSMQEKQYNSGEVIIPILTSLPAMIDAVKNGSDKIYVNNKINSYISLYKDMQRDSMYFRNNPDSKMKEHIKNLQLSNNENLQGINYSLAERLSHKVKKSKFNSHQFTNDISLYDIEDSIYIHINKLSQLHDSLIIYKNNKTNEINLHILSQIESILKDKSSSFKDKSRKIATILVNNDKFIDKHLLKTYKEMVFTLSSLQPLEQKFQSLEPRLASTKQMKNIASSESYRELSLKKYKSNSTIDNDNEINNTALNNHHLPRQIHTNHSSRILRSSRKSLRLSDSTYSPGISRSTSTTNSQRGNTTDIIAVLSNAETINNAISKESTLIITPSTQMSVISNQIPVSDSLPREIIDNTKSITKSLKETENDINTLDNIKISRSNSPRKLPRKHIRHSKQQDSVPSELSKTVMKNKGTQHLKDPIVNPDNSTKPVTHTLKRSSSWVATQIEQFENIDQPKKSFSAPLPGNNKQESDMFQYNVKAQISLIDKGIFSQNTVKQTTDPATCEEIKELKLQRNVSGARLFKSHSVRNPIIQEDSSTAQVLKK